jgi:hypothetical protein
MNLKFLQRFSAGVLGLGLLIGCGGAVGIGDEGLTPISEVPITEAVTTVVDAPTTTAVVDARPACSMSAVDPGKVNESGQTAGDLDVVRCIGDWMITQRFPDCGECEGVTPFHIEDNAWKMYEPLYIYCYSVPDGYGPSPEGTPADQSFILSTIQIAVSRYACDQENQGYHSESAADQLLYGDIGPRVSALQEALIAAGFLEDSADGEYGPATVEAVMNFQFSQNVPVDGIAGPNTHELLGIAYP